MIDFGTGPAVAPGHPTAAPQIAATAAPTPVPRSRSRGDDDDLFDVAGPLVISLLLLLFLLLLLVMAYLLHRRRARRLDALAEAKWAREHGDVEMKSMDADGRPRQSTVTWDHGVGPAPRERKQTAVDPSHHRLNPLWGRGWSARGGLFERGLDRAFSGLRPRERDVL